MSRQLHPSLAAALDAGVIVPAVLVMLTFKTSTRYVWSGVGDLIYDGQTYTGVGSFGSLQPISEGTGVQADGTAIKLSGIDPLLMGECLDDIQIGAPAKVWFALLQGSAILGAPYLLFAGTVDKPTISVAPETISISLALETQLINLQRPSARRYTNADQRLYYPTDNAFSWVEMLNDINLIWGN